MSELKRDGTTRAGEHSLTEILSQPRCWSDCLRELEQGGSTDQILKQLGKCEEWLFIGCGSSYYAALAAAASWSALTGTRGRAIPASELLLYPDTVLAGSQNLAPVLISRSGRTSEVLRAAALLGTRSMPSLAVTCASQSPLEKAAPLTMRLAPADEQSTVMTRSFTSMLLGLQYLAARAAGDQGFLRELKDLENAAGAALAKMHPAIRALVSERQFADYVCLGQGALYGLACESALKVTEMSVSYAQSFHTLEFRHGPKSIVSPETLVFFLLSEDSYDAECEVLEEVKGLGGTTIAITNRADPRARANSDLLIELGFETSPLPRTAAFVFAAQLTGLYTGLKKGLDPDNPRNLTRVVVLNEEEFSKNSQHAPL